MQRWIAVLLLPGVLLAACGGSENKNEPQVATATVLSADTVSPSSAQATDTPPSPTEPPTTATNYPMVGISDYPVDTAERALAEWLVAWKNNDFDRMAEFSQKTWLNGEANPAQTLSDQYGFKDLLGSEITNVVVTTAVANDVTATIYYAFGSEVQRKQITARVIREAGPYDPSPAGDWGVNPISTLREEEVP